MIELASLRHLKLVVECGSFANAATKLGVDISTLSRHVATLEDELGLTLLERKRTGVQLTSGGSIVMAEVGRTLADLDTVVRTAHRAGAGMEGEILLGMCISPVSNVLHSLLAAWRKKSR